MANRMAAGAEARGVGAGASIDVHREVPEVGPVGDGPEPDQRAHGQGPGDRPPGTHTAPMMIAAADRAERTKPPW